MKCGKEPIATALGCDVADVEPYQPTRHRGVFQVGGQLYTSRIVGSDKKLPDGFVWQKMIDDFVAKLYKIDVYVDIDAVVEEQEGQ